VVESRAEIAGCRDLGAVHVDGPVYTVAGGFIGAAADRAILRKNKTADLGGNTLLRLGEDDDEAYDCPNYPSNMSQAANRGGLPTQSQREIPKSVRIFHSTERSAVAPCTRIGAVDRSITCPPEYSGGLSCVAYQGARRGGNAILLTGNSDAPADVYLCPAPAVAASVGEPPRSTPTVIGEAASESTTVRVTPSEDEVRGCVYVDHVDTSIACPQNYPEGIPCMAYRAKKQGGNMVLAQGAGKVYRCPTSP
jgi:hypothetical protein